MRSAGWTAQGVASWLEAVPWARPGARRTRDFEEVMYWLAQRSDPQTVAALMRSTSETMTSIMGRSVTQLPRRPPTTDPVSHRCQ